MAVNLPKCIVPSGTGARRFESAPSFRVLSSMNRQRRMALASRSEHLCPLFHGDSTLRHEVSLCGKLLFFAVWVCLLGYEPTCARAKSGR